MIINTGSRTDIPAYYSEWFYNRIKEGYVLTRNPYYPEQVSRYRLTPDVVDVICFCSKNPEPMLKRLKELDAFRQLWFVTITPYGKEIEPGVPDKARVMDSFKTLSDMVGMKAISWRYDPIFITEKYSLEFHIRSFEKMADNLKGYTDNCVISFIDLYEKTKRNFHGVRNVTDKEQEILISAFSTIAKENKLQIHLCCENAGLVRENVDADGCMSQTVLEKALDCKLRVPKKKSARGECSCLLGADIGAYNTCGHGCLYCYANYDRKTVERNMHLHNPSSPLLIGDVTENDVVKLAEQKPWKDGQLNIFDLL